MIGFIRHFFFRCVIQFSIAHMWDSGAYKYNEENLYLYSTCVPYDTFIIFKSVNFEIIYNCLQIASYDLHYTFSQHTKHRHTQCVHMVSFVRYLAFGFDSSIFVQHLNGYIISVELSTLFSSGYLWCCCCWLLFFSTLLPIYAFYFYCFSKRYQNWKISKTQYTLLYSIRIGHSI